jgi:hypothetical protein
MRLRWITMVAAGLGVWVAPAVTRGNISLSVEPNSQVIGVGEVFDVGIRISGLGSSSAPSLGAFDLDLSFDNSILSFNSVAFGDPILGDQLDLFAGSISGFDGSAPGLVDFFELSLDSAADLDSLQADSFTLATLTFTGTGLGTSALLLSLDPPNALSDSVGSPLSATLENGQASVVPVPSSILLGTVGLGLVGWMRRRNPRP